MDPSKTITLPPIPASTALTILLCIAALFALGLAAQALDRWFHRASLRREGLGRDLLLPRRRFGRF